MNYYSLLGVAPTSTPEVIKKAYRKKSHTYHPDKGGSNEMFKELSKAKEVLLDTLQRDRYDMSLLITLSEYVYSCGGTDYYAVDKSKTGTGEPSDPLREGMYITNRVGNKIFIIPAQDREVEGGREAS